ncbi:MAG: hypothetical protein MZV64_42690 [Ignavibacteriales bacterium]|nr:hypothetical protein [Ignavibacteriales bacterium]
MKTGAPRASRSIPRPAAPSASRPRTTSHSLWKWKSSTIRNPPFARYVAQARPPRYRSDTSSPARRGRRSGNFISSGPSIRMMLPPSGRGEHGRSVSRAPV